MRLPSPEDDHQDTQGFSRASRAGAPRVRALSLVETAIHWNGTIFQSGFDTESTVAVLLLLLELAYGLARLLVVLLPSALRSLSFVCFDQLAVRTLNFGTVLPEISPPLSLRI